MVAIAINHLGGKKEKLTNDQLEAFFVRNINNMFVCYHRQPDLFEESQGSSDFTTGSTLISQTAGDKMRHSQGKLCAQNQDTLLESQSTPIGDQNSISVCEMVLSGATCAQGTSVFLFSEHCYCLFLLSCIW